MTLRSLKPHTVEMVILAYAAIISTAAFGWQVWEWWRARPTLMVQPATLIVVPPIALDSPQGPTSATTRIRLRLINVGPRPVTVYAASASWWSDDFWKAASGAGDGMTMSLDHDQGKDTTLPLRIEEAGVGVWDTTQIIEFSRLPHLESSDRMYPGVVSISLTTTAGPIHQSFPVFVAYNPPGESSAPSK